MVFKTPQVNMPAVKAARLRLACMKGFDVESDEGAGAVPRRTQERRPRAERACLASPRLKRPRWAREAL